MRPLVVLFVTLDASLLAGRSALASMTDSDWGRLQSGVVVEADGAFAPGEPFRVKEIDVHDQQVPGPGIELIGRLDAVDGEVRTITLLGVVVGLTDSTAVRREDRTGISAADLVPGDWLEVDALAGQDGTLVADRVKRYDADPGKQQIEGTVTTVDPSRRHLTIGPVETRVSKSATIRGGVVLAVPRSIDDDYDARAAWSAFGGSLTGGGRFQYEIEPETEFDLNPARVGNRTRGNWTADLHVDAHFTPWLEAFAKAGQRGLRVIFDDEGDEANVSDWSVQQAYLLARPRPLVALQVGRQNFDEPREWLYDENLDAVRLRFAHGAWRGETSVSTRQGTASSRLADRTNWILLGGREMRRGWLAEGYVIHRPRQGGSGDEPSWIGLRSHGRLASGWNHWLELSTLRGSYLGESTNAWAFDGGLRLRLVRRLGLEITGGWAWGSGGPSAGDRFVQTGLHDNNDKLGGVTSFKYYGELLDPELSNLSIATAAAGFRPTNRSSFDLVFHKYLQPHPEQRLFGTNLETRPRGGDGDVGREWNLIVGFEEISGLDVEYVYGVFDPGGAFDDRAARAHFHKLSVVLTLGARGVVRLGGGDENPRTPTPAGGERAAAKVPAPPSAETPAPVPDRTEPQVAVEEPPPPAAAPAAPAARAATAATTTVAVSAPAAGGAWGVHVSSMLAEAGAQRELEMLKAAGFAAVSRHVRVPAKGLWFRIYVGPYATKEDAQRVAAEIMQSRLRDYAMPQRIPDEGTGREDR